MISVDVKNRARVILVLLKPIPPDMLRKNKNTRQHLDIDPEQCGLCGREPSTPPDSLRWPIPLG